jgi:hypothetical protein
MIYAGCFNYSYMSYDQVKYELFKKNSKFLNQKDLLFFYNKYYNNLYEMVLGNSQKRFVVYNKINDSEFFKIDDRKYALSLLIPESRDFLIKVGYEFMKEKELFIFLQKRLLQRCTLKTN